MEVSVILHQRPAALPRFPDCCDVVIGHLAVDLVLLVKLPSTQMIVITVHGLLIHFEYRKEACYQDDSGDYVLNVSVLSPFTRDHVPSAMAIPEFVSIRDLESLPKELIEANQSSSPVLFYNLTHCEHEEGVVTRLDDRFMADIWAAVLTAAM